jgi:hypothetical protein
VNLAARVAKLEAEAVPDSGPDPAALRAEAERWARAAGEVAALPGVDDAAAGAMAEYLALRFGLYVSFAGSDRGDQERRHADVLLAFLRLVPADLRGPVLTGNGLRGDRTSGGGWLDSWLLTIARIDSRLPPDLAPDVLAVVVRVYLDRPADVGSATACTSCGLLVPDHKWPPLESWRLAPGCLPTDKPLRYDLPRFFDACPHCHGADAGGWQAAAAAELVEAAVE